MKRFFRIRSFSSVLCMTLFVVARSAASMEFPVIEIVDTLSGSSASACGDRSLYSSARLFVDSGPLNLDVESETAGERQKDQTAANLPRSGKMKSTLGLPAYLMERE